LLASGVCDHSWSTWADLACGEQVLCDARSYMPTIALEDGSAADGGGAANRCVYAIRKAKGVCG
jgi:hypothetical protein